MLGRNEGRAAVRVFITTGEGGMLTTEDPQFAHWVERLRLPGMKRDAWRHCQQFAGRHYEVCEAGFKTHMADFQTVLGAFWRSPTAEV